METKTLVVNGIPRQVLVDSDTLLVDVLRNQLQITSVKVGCGQGQCGACSVILDGKVTRACIVKMRRVPDQAQITTLEGVGTPAKLHPLQESWMFHGAAQCGFCTPGFIVSAKALLDSNPAPSREEVRDWFQKHHNICRCTGYKPLVDAVMDAAAVMRGDKDIEELRYKLPADGRAFGSRLPRPSALVKVTGLAEYGADAAVHMPPDTLHLALAQAKVSHAIIKGIDTSEAEKMPGVVRVLTHKDVKGKNRITGLITFADNKGDGWDRPILNDTKVFQYGDALAIVCADSEAHARAAADKVKFDLELLPEYMSAPEAMAPDAIEIHPGTPNIYYEPHIEKGEDTKPFFDDPENVVVEDSFYTQRQPHLNIEPDVGYGYLNEQGQLVIHSKSIGLHLHALMIAPGLGVKFPEELVMVQNTTGGTFGYKFSPTMEALIGVAVLATGRPCHLRYNYQQQQQYTGKRSPFWTKVRMAANKKTGKIVAMETDWTCDHGPYSEFGDLLTLRGAQFIGAGYGIPNIRGDGRTVATNHAWGAAFRGYGGPESEFPSEVLMDELAEKLGMPAANLEATVKSYNEHVESGEPDEFGREYTADAIKNNSAYCAAISKIEGEHYYAIPLKALVVMTLGGVSTNTDGQVLDVDGAVIPGLYAAGECVGGIWGRFVSGGTGVMGPIVFGRLAARAAMANEPATGYTLKTPVAVITEDMFAKNADGAESLFDMSQTLADGEYEATVDGQEGPMTVKVTVADGKIAAVVVAENHETQAVAAAALEKVPQAIVDANSVDVDGVSGATLTSGRIKDAAVKCLTQAAQ